MIQFVYFVKKLVSIKRKRTREPLTKCAELRSNETICQAAVAKNDNKILALTSKDLVAAEGHYHRSCYRKYTKSYVKKDLVLRR